MTAAPEAIAEAVADADGDGLATGLGGEAFDLGGGVATCGEVELVGFGEHLDGASEGSVNGVEEGADNIKRTEELFPAAGV